MQLAGHSRTGYITDLSTISRLPFDITERRPRTVSVTNRMPKMTITGNSRDVEFTVDAGAIDVSEQAAIARLPFDVAKRKPRTVGPSDRVPDMAITRDTAHVQFTIDFGNADSRE